MPIPTTQTHGRSKEVHGPVLGCQPCSKMCGRTGTTVWGRLAVVMGAPRPGAPPTLIVSNSFCAAHRTWRAWSKRSILPGNSSRWRRTAKPASMSSATTSHVSGRRRASGWRRSTRSTRARWRWRLPPSSRWRSCLGRRRRKPSNSTRRGSACRPTARRASGKRATASRARSRRRRGRAGRRRSMRRWRRRR